MALFLKNIEIPVGYGSGESSIRPEVCSILGIPADEVQALRIVKKSLDARKKSRIVHRYQVEIDVLNETAVLAASHGLAEKAEPKASANPLENLDLQNLRFRHPPCIIGSGPAGTFAALTLSAAGQPALVVERGEAVENRLRTVGRLRQKGELNTESNYCFGEGGAGTFSDGKLTCGKNHPLIRHVFDEFVRFGAPAAIQYDAHPHIGTDYLLRIAINMRQNLEAMGTRFLFGRRLIDFRTGGRHARFEVGLDDGSWVPTDHIILAIGHSARDTYEMLLNKGVTMVPKPFAVGARFEHPQDEINRIQFGTCELLPAAEYKLAAQAGDRGIWTFCMCPGGHLLPTSAQPGHLAINGMSYHARNSGFANAAVVVNVRREDFYQGHPLDGMKFQQQLERSAFAAGGSNYSSPAQRLEDFIAGRQSRGELKSTYRPGVTAARLDQILPDFIANALKGALSEYNNRMRGFISPHALVVGVESKTSSPVAITRDDRLASISHPGLFPAGEGAGFAGGIVSAALDGVRIGRAVVAEEIQRSVHLH